MAERSESGRPGRVRPEEEARNAPASPKVPAPRPARSIAPEEESGNSAAAGRDEGGDRR